MGKKRFTFVSLLLAFFICTASAVERLSSLSPMQRSSAELARRMLGDDTGKYDYYVSKELVKYNGSERLLVFVDMKPRAGWEHPCKYVYVDPDNISENNCVMRTAKYPPTGTRLVPALKKNGVAEDLVDVIVKRGPENKFAGHTYAVIISGGKDRESNSARYWNDCSFIYQTLTRRYRVPKGNVKVLMSDGTDPAYDMCSELGGEYMSSPLDLDGDGAADIQYSATKANVKSVLENVSSSLTDKDHLFVYVIDHGGYDRSNKQSYICLWNGERLYPDEMNEYLSHGDAGYVSVLLGQCYSGGFADALKANNRIIMTACGNMEYSYACEELPFDEFVYRWTSAINGYDPFGDIVDTNSEEGVTPLINAYDYACRNDIYASGEAAYAMETPSLSVLENSTAEDLALDTIPPTVYLYIPRGDIEEPTSKTGKKYPLSFRFWDNCDVWLNNDSTLTFEHEMPHVSKGHPYVNIYTIIKNRGVKPYNDQSVKIKTWIAQSAYVLDEKAWKAYREGELPGGIVQNVTIDKTIQPGDTIIKKAEYTFDKNNEDLYNAALKPGFNLCILSFLADKKGSQSFPTDDDGIAAVWSTDKLGQKNRCNLFGKKASTAYQILPTLIMDKLLDLVVMERKDAETVSDNNPIKARLCLPSATAGNVSLSGCKRQAAKKDEIVITDSVSRISNIRIPARQALTLDFSASYIANEEISKPLSKIVDVAVADAATGRIIGGETYNIHIDPRPAIKPEIDVVTKQNGEKLLTAANIKEDVTYEWYDKDGNLVGTGESISVSPSLAAGEYTLCVKSTTDNAENSVTKTVGKQPFVDKIDNPFPGKIDLSFSEPAAGGMKARTSSLYGDAPVTEKDIEEGSTHVSIDSGNAAKAVAVTILKDGNTVETHRIINK